jgi:hypothetical protein
MNELPAIRNTGDDYGSLMALAKELCTTGFLPQAIKTPAQAVAIILTGRELGLPPMQSLRSICIIQGKPELSADLQLSIFHRDGGRSKWLTLTATEAKLLLKHPNGDEHTEVFTMEDAKRAGLAAGVNWQKYPKAMLRSRAITAGLKSIGFEPLTGAYAPGEIGGPEVVEGEPGTVTVEPPLGQAMAQAMLPPSDAAPPLPTPPAATPAPKAPLTIATANTRAAALDRLGCQEEGPAKDTLKGYLVALKWLEPDKSVEQWPYRFVPLSATELEAVRAGMTEFSQSSNAVIPYAPHGIDTATLPAKPTAPTWESFVMPFGKSKGTALGKFEKAELDFYIGGFKVRETVDVQSADGSIVSQPLPPESVASQKLLRAALDEAAAHLATKKG